MVHAFLIHFKNLSSWMPSIKGPNVAEECPAESRIVMKTVRARVHGVAGGTGGGDEFQNGNPQIVDGWDSRKRRIHVPVPGHGDEPRRPDVSANSASS